LLRIVPRKSLGANLLANIAREIAFRLGRWAFFAALISLFPIGFAALRALTREDAKLNLHELLGTGELLIVISAVLGGALSELISLRERRQPLRRFFVGCVAATVAIGSAAWYADISAARLDHARLDTQTITIGSLWLFGFAVVICAACIIVAVVSEGMDG
jgi:hypothetical protein